jgi:hypothetical protein
VSFPVRVLLPWYTGHVDAADAVPASAATHAAITTTAEADCRYLEMRIGRVCPKTRRVVAQEEPVGSSRRDTRLAATA